MNTIRERILARPDLADARAVRDIFALADGLNMECAMEPFPTRVTAAFILSLRPNRDIILSLLRDAAAGADVSTRAAELMSPMGTEAVEMRMTPPMITGFDVMDAMFNDDGTEKQ